MATYEARLWEDTEAHAHRFQVLRPPAVTRCRWITLAGPITAPITALVPQATKGASRICG
ncbi:hypothetical protein ACIQOW_11335 [Kitasatospora sp. NPDC091335]|uniref:hypothetical protein n=1 Tax=Kitasatospora sp. NPDC091335 TaxID=3364085 RepID=UPI00382A4C2D